MRLKVFTLRLDPATGRFDDRDVAVFQSERDVLDVSDFQIVYDGQPVWGLLVRLTCRENRDSLNADRLVCK